MIALGKIVGKKDNLYSVYIPSLSTTDTDFIIEAPVCYQNGNLNYYQYGDLVWVERQNLNKSDQVIIGKQYTGEPDPLTNKLTGNDLNINGTTVLNGDITINGINITDIISKLQSQTTELMIAKKELQVKIDHLENENLALKDKLNYYTKNQ